MIELRRTTTIKGVSSTQLIPLAEWLDLNDIDYEVVQDKKSRTLYDVTVPRRDKSASLVQLARYKKECTR